MGPHTRSTERFPNVSIIPNGNLQCVCIMHVHDLALQVCKRDPHISGLDLLYNLCVFLSLCTSDSMHL